jgi:D-beta-D-heptose 7-phosphate kinase/D-beta-D-heptose 1-phosphate adenosyltransferase
MQHPALLTTWDAIGHPKILVLGDIILDRYTWGNAERVSPEAPVLVLKADTHEVRLGGAASVAGLLRGLDADVTLAGVIGDDASGRVVLRLLDEAGIDSLLFHCDEGRPTTTKARFIGRADGKHPHHVLRVDEECDQLLTDEVQRRIAEQMLDRMSEFDIILISD